MKKGRRRLNVWQAWAKHTQNTEGNAMDNFGRGVAMHT